ncbi:Hypothetical protein ADIARSV_0760 [Arcticibacter svalbardensis MN12-7]|uniref:DUF4175 family protein n=1 Tax=Arcticibacter svalbardensis MN12-7 TaxID=1150600 RepID=R9GWI9_9SPHI|nr:DUF4175 family protein [Arcticibacter svalbardensis]EOR96116.1 Hypothetical protein ADIARSV_0760 [Arcticibacter svalbardensis MN12-7]
MHNPGGEKLIAQLKFKFTSLYALRILIISFTISILLTAVLVYMLHFHIWIFLPVILAVFISLALRHPFWQITSADISKYLDFHFPELEESTGLLLKPSAELSGLELLQKEKVNRVLTELKSPDEPLKKLVYALAFLVVGLGLTFLIRMAKPLTEPVENPVSLSSRSMLAVKELVPAEISGYTVSINPPAYTREKERTQQQFSLKAEMGATVTWNIKTNIRVKNIKLLFNGKEAVSMKRLQSSDNEWSTSRKMSQSGFYQVELDGKKSDLYAIEVITDLPARIEINTPKQHTTIDYGQPLQVNLSVYIKDDYGISDAFISATMASGKGEGVSFTEQKLSFNTSFSNKRDMQLRQNIDLKALGMKPGDELYFFVKATDNFGQSSRSDVYFVSIVDTAELMSLSAVSNGVNLVPEYFRSERQIIIDTEKLLKERPSLSEEVFKSRSNALGVDQKLLRLRYGTFLGEESETEIGGDHEEHEGEEHAEGKEHAAEHGTKSEEKFGDVQSIMDQYAHKHDVAEDATFFEPELKARLKAVLTEMWSAELRLRTFKTQEALPFEYKALRLLKDLQQKSRAYVAKTTVKVSQIKEEKRLSGELDKIMQSTQQRDYEKKDRKGVTLKQVLAVLEKSKTGQGFKEADQLLLRDSERYLIEAASANPASYLPALKGIRDLQKTKSPSTKSIETVQKAVQKLIAKEQPIPQLKALTPGATLYNTYFNHLKQTNR